MVGDRRKQAQWSRLYDAVVGLDAVFLVSCQCGFDLSSKNSIRETADANSRKDSNDCNSQCKVEVRRTISE